MTTDRLFVYGTLRRFFGHAMHAVLAEHAEFAGEGTMAAQLFDLGRYPGAVLSAAGDERVVGEVYRLREPQAAETLRRLDEYEGVAPGATEPREYRRDRTSVRMTGGETIDAWVYVLNRVPRHGRRIESGDYTRWRAEPSTST